MWKADKNSCKVLNAEVTLRIIFSYFCRWTLEANQTNKWIQKILLDENKHAADICVTKQGPSRKKNTFALDLKFNAASRKNKRQI